MPCLINCCTTSMEWIVSRISALSLSSRTCDSELDEPPPLISVFVYDSSWDSISIWNSWRVLLLMAASQRSVNWICSARQRIYRKRGKTWHFIIKCLWTIRFSKLANNAFVDVVETWKRKCQFSMGMFRGETVISNKRVALHWRASKSHT